MAIKTLGIIGPNSTHCSEDLYNFGYSLGEQLAERIPALVCGGMGGFMEAVCRGVKSKGNARCLNIGILPTDEPESGNAWLDIVVPTGMGLARNVLVVKSSAMLLAAGGGAGTLSELAFALQLQKTVLCIRGFGGFSQWIADAYAAQYPKQLLVADDLGGAIKQLEYFF